MHQRTHIDVQMDQLKPSMSAKEPCLSAEEPCISVKRPCISTKEPCISVKEPCISAKEPWISAEEVFQLAHTHGSTCTHFIKQTNKQIKTLFTPCMQTRTAVARSCNLRQIQDWINHRNLSEAITAPTNKICRRASSEQRPRMRSCHEQERSV